MEKQLIPESVNAAIRCRTVLKPALNHQLLIVGYLSKVSQNKGLKAHLNRQHNALLLDVHGLKDLTTGQALTFNLDHVHCQLGRTNLTHQSRDQYVLMTVNVRQYQTQYQKVTETRYGFFNVRLKPHVETTLKTLNQQYHDHLTPGQLTLLTQAKTMVNTLNFEVASFDELVKRFALSNMDDRTQMLENVIDRLYHGKGLTEKQTKKFHVKTTNASVQQQLSNLKQQVVNLQKQVTTLHKQNKRLTNLTRDQATIIERQKPTSLWQAIKQYFKQTHSLQQTKPILNAERTIKSPNEPSKPTALASDEQLVKLKAKFKH